MPIKLSFNKSTYTPVDVATEEELLEFANKVREAGGANVLEALLPSEPNHAGQCLIANALNFSCKVYPFHYNGKSGTHERLWKMILPLNITRQQAEAISAAVECELEVHDGSEFGYPDEYRLVLPQHIGNAAQAFDRGMAFQEYDSNKLEVV